MSILLSKSLREIVFWMAWIIIPFIMEILPAVFGFIILYKKNFSVNKKNFVGTFPEITIIVPVYNSEHTLKECIESLYYCSYPTKLIDLIIVNNMSQDNSFQVFAQCQKEFENLSMRYMNSKQGKSKALNAALFNSSGKYIIHVDSDGIIHKDAIKNMIVRFENNSNIHCMTGVVLSNIRAIENTKEVFLKHIRRCEFFEYAQAFLAGRNFQSELDSIYTLSGAFSAFRKSTILKTQLYNSKTVCEDTHITFQIRKLLKQKVYLSYNSIFFVDPIDNLNKLYTQRQRWQRGEIEVSHMFFKDKMKSSLGFFGNFMVRVLMYDHTFAFPRMIWYFAIIFLFFMNYPIYLVGGSMVIIYALYVMSAFLFYLNVKCYLKQYKNIRKYYKSKKIYIFLMPIYNFCIFWIRFAGMINSIKIKSRWRTLNLSEELDAFLKVVNSDFRLVCKKIEKIRHLVND
ncbi:putative glycosyltransferase, exosortase G system-associated [Clostridium felsineum]|uniref:TIGR03111 family XrtG-associated glycosyltransferase n=1 Tax=Clostridium felsineum TaxID=36839 RepID=UPI00214D5123|nr:TIGR03111 family XrtG-associated glycosyltransferase [Clostridium felsineum]MCR3760336.1 putative glycosyltransferase, exosortase G system-associated [Clostridium felsineum]